MSTSGRDAADRLDYLRSMAALLWPESAVDIGVRRSRTPAEAADFLLLPSGGMPRLLAPAGHPRAAAAAVRHYGEHSSVRAQAQALALSGAVRAGLIDAAGRGRVRIGTPAGTDTITTHLFGMLGRPVLVSMHLSAARANRKPVLQLLDHGGATIGYAKVGVDPLTRRLVADEGAALGTLAEAGLRAVTVPRVLHRGTWHGLEVLVLSPLPVWKRRQPDGARMTAALVEVAAVGGVTEGLLGTSPYWALLRERLDSAPAGPRTDAVRAAADRLEQELGELELRFGSWHGDWTRWNTRTLASTVLVWDWERFGRPAPLGLDGLHRALQDAIQTGTPLPVAARGCLGSAAETLAPFDVHGPRAAATARLYLLDLAVRYAQDDQAAAGGRGGEVERWLLPALAGRPDAHTPTRGSS